jgi:hypothetical protein
VLRSFNSCISITGFVQLSLLAYFYTDPASRIVPALLYAAMLIANSGLLVVLAYQAFQLLRPVVAVLAAVLAFPGLLLLLVAVVSWALRTIASA